MQSGSTILGMPRAGQIAYPIRGILRDQKNITVIMGEVTGVDKDQKHVFVSNAQREEVPIAYDYLILATGVSREFSASVHDSRVRALVVSVSR